MDSHTRLDIKDGTEFSLEVSSSSLRTHEGNLASRAIRDITERQSTEELQSLKFSKMISALSESSIRLPLEQIDREVDRGLKVLAEVFDLDQVGIVMTDPTEASGFFSHRFVRTGIPDPPVGDLDEAFPFLASRISKGEIFCVSALGDLPEEARAERDYMLATGLQSWLVIPLDVGGERLGRAGATSFRTGHDWNSLLIPRFRQAAEILATALSRKRSQRILAESEERTELAVEAASLAAWEWRLDRNEFWASDKVYGALRPARRIEADLRNAEDSVHPNDREYLRDLIEQAKREPMAFRNEYRVIRSDGTVRWIDRFGRSYAKPGEKPYRLAGVSVDITDKKLVQMEFEQQFQFEKTLAEISAMFVNLEPPHVDGQIREAQKRICETLGLDRSVLFQVSRAGDDVTVTHSWVAEGFEQAPSVTARDLPWCTRVVLSGQRLSFARVDDLPEEAAIDKGTFRQYGPKSNVTFPLFSTGKVIGCLAFGSMRKEREWPSTLVERLGLVAEVFANALARARADQDLHQAYREIEELKRRLEKENVYLREEVKLEHHHNEVIGNSEGIRRALKKAEQVAITDSTVLLLGETGTGKELIARTIHEHSRRKNRIMVKVNCAALPASLVESELFGREKGAFTGALTREVGRFELANGSTILLDEIGELPVELQSKLLRVLQEGEFERLGSPKTIKVDVRVIAATSKNLQQAVREGKFREDLFYRLNVFPITIPPLRERREDIAPLGLAFREQP